MWYDREGMKEKLLAADKKFRITALAQKYDITLLTLFGSQATGKTYEKSDADFAFASKRKLSPREVAEFAFDLSSIAEFSNIELIDLHDAPPLLLKNIAVSGIAVYESEPLTFALFKIYALKRFMEAQKLFALRAASLDSFLSAKPL